MKIVFRMIPHWSFVLLYLFCVIESCEKVYLTGADSFHCRCNSTNCDFLEFELPKPAEYLLVTSDKSKLRFSKYNSAISKESNGGTPVNLYEAGQKLRGFGGAITDAMLLELFKLSENARNNAIEAWFGGNGAHYTTIRIPIGGTDFSSFPYSLDEVEDDFELEHFALSKIDLELRIPVMEHAKRISEHQIDYLASSWSSPKWLKNSNEFNGFGKLKGEAGDKYHKTWANYHVKYLKSMESLGFPIWAITTQNEPSMGLIYPSAWNALGWTPKHQVNWLEIDLIPIFKQNNISSKIIIFDDNRIFLPAWVDYILENEFVRNNTDGIAVHWYWDKLVPASVLASLNTNYPEKEIIASEACSHHGPNFAPFQFSWSHGEDYSRDILQNLQNSASSWIDWNMALNIDGGPNWAGNHRNAAVMIDAVTDEFYKAPTFYHLMHFSRFILPGSTVIKSDFSNGIIAMRPDGYKVAVVLNSGIWSKKYSIIDGKNFINIEIDARSIQTVLWL